MTVYWFDIAVLAFLTWGAVSGYFQGLSRSLVNFTSWFFVLGLAFYFKGPVASFVNQQYGVNPLITRVLARNVDLPLKVSGTPVPGDDLPAFIHRLPVAPSTKNSLWEYFYQEGEKLIYQGGSPADFIYSWMAEGLVQLLCFGAVLAVTAALFQLFEESRALKRREEIFPGVKSLGGLLLGFLRNFLILGVVVALTAPLMEVSSFILREDILRSYSVHIALTFLHAAVGIY